MVTGSWGDVALYSWAEGGWVCGRVGGGGKENKSANGKDYKGVRVGMMREGVGQWGACLRRRQEEELERAVSCV